MTSGSLVPTLAHKELRALAPVFLATLALVPLCALGGEPELMTIGLGVYVLGACALGALSIGHEFTHDTLGQLLAQPGRRAQLLTVKWLVLAALLCLLATAATVTIWPWVERGFVGVGYAGRAEALRWPIVLIPALLAAFVAPLLTMLTRGAIAGTVFTVAVYAGLWLVTPGITSPSLPDANLDIEFYTSAMLWIATGVSAVSAVAGAVMFGRLESTGSPGITAWVASRRAGMNTTRSGARAPRHPAVALMAKELRLQTVAFVIAGLYLATGALFTATAPHSTEVVYALEGGTLLYQFILAMLIGALASAEERGFGTLHWQVLQPYATWKQWTIKVATALTLTVLLVAALPTVLQAIDADAVERFALGLRWSGFFLWTIRIKQAWIFATILLVLTATSLFTSSFNRSSLHALLATGLLAVVGGGAIKLAFGTGGRAVTMALDLNTFFHGISMRGRTEPLPATWTYADQFWADRITFTVAVTAILGFLLLLLSMGLKNHRSAETPRTVVTRQVVTLLAYGVIASLMVGGGQPLLDHFLVTH